MRVVAAGLTDADIDRLVKQAQKEVEPNLAEIELPTYRGAAGRSRAAIVLPEEVCGPIGDAVLDRLAPVGARRSARGLLQRGQQQLRSPEGIGEEAAAQDAFVALPNDARGDAAPTP